MYPNICSLTNRAKESTGRDGGFKITKSYQLFFAKLYITRTFGWFKPVYKVTEMSVNLEF